MRNQPSLTHGVPLLRGPNSAPSLHAAAQSPALFQILKGQWSQVRARALRKMEGAAETLGVGAGVCRGCAGLTLRPEDITGWKIWSRKPSRLPDLWTSPVGQGEGWCHGPGHGASHALPTSMCPL